MRKIEFVPSNHLEKLRGLLNEYLTELSQFDPDIKFDKNNVPIYKWLDCYFSDYKRQAYYLKVDDNVAGFCLVRLVDNSKYEIAEFYVKPQFRASGNSGWFATQIINLYPLSLEIATRHTNPRAVKFWSRVVLDYAFTENKDDIWHTWLIKKD